MSEEFVYRILVTGSRDWTDEETISHAIYGELIVAGRLDPPPVRVILIHGAAEGADTLADQIAGRWQIQREAYPVKREDWKRYGSSAGPRRNKIMVRLGADVCLAFPLGISKGTRGCMELARKARIPVVAYSPGCTLLHDDRTAVS